jgi:hypothetical protein
MRFVFFVHSAVSDWNHGNAHFLRGLMSALARRGHDVVELGAARGLVAGEPAARPRAGRRGRIRARLPGDPTSAATTRAGRICSWS